jgi:hypothetical protein
MVTNISNQSSIYITEIKNKMQFSTHPCPAIPITLEQSTELMEF